MLKPLSMPLAVVLFASLLPACGRRAPEGAPAEEIRVVHVPVAASCASPAGASAATQSPAPLAAAPPAAQSAPPKTLAKTAKADGSALQVNRLVVATEVDRDRRQPLGQAARFEKGDFEKLYAFLEIDNPGGESEIVVSFDPPSDKPEKGRVTLGVGTSPKWRTWAFSRAFDEAGSWEAVVRTTSGKELARTPFEVVL